MTDQSHTRTDTVNFKDWVLGRGEFSEENLKKARNEFFTKMGKHWSELMLASVEKAFSDHDAVPEAIAYADGEPAPTSGGEAGLSSRDGTGNTQEPVAWAVWHLSEEAPGRIAYAKPIQSLRGTGETRGGEEFIPLYGKPVLTDEERAAIVWCAELLDELDSGKGDTLRELLERLTGPTSGT